MVKQQLYVFVQVLCPPGAFTQLHPPVTSAQPQPPPSVPALASVPVMPPVPVLPPVPVVPPVPVLPPVPVVPPVPVLPPQPSIAPATTVSDTSIPATNSDSFVNMPWPFSSMVDQPLIGQDDLVPTLGETTPQSKPAPCLRRCLHRSNLDRDSPPGSRSTGGVMTAGNDFVGTIEAIYCVDRSFPEWLGGVLGSARPWFDEGGGLFGCAWQLDADGGVVFTDHVSSCGPGAPDLRRMMERQSTEIAKMGAHVLRANRCGLSSRVLKRRDVFDFFMRPLRAAGIADALGINGLDTLHSGVWIGAYLLRSRSLARGEEHRLRRLARHLAAGNRLRRRLSGRAPTDADSAAILSPEGRVEHAAASAKPAEVRAALREAVLEMDRARGAERRTNPEGSVYRWRVLADARFSLIDRFESGGRRYVVACENELSAAGASGLTAREQQVVALYRLGADPKLIAYELGLADSTVRVLLGRAARRLGIPKPRGLRQSGGA
jgi:DNA-binding CsgD family transcriptional regulator